MLSKSDYKAALECPKRLWLSRHLPEQKAEPTPASEARKQSGIEIGIIAQLRFPEGVPIPTFEFGNLNGVQVTRDLIEAGQEVIFEATFCHENRITRVDILKKEEAGWHLIEVKGSSKYNKKDHLDDVAFQVALLQDAGITVSEASVLFLNKNYIWQGGDWDVAELFTQERITEDVFKELPKVLPRARGFLELIEKTDYPSVEGKPPYIDPVIIAACKLCDFKTHCSKRVPDDHLFHLGLHHTRFQKLKNQGITSILQVPADFELPPKEALRLKAFQTGKPAVSPDLAQRLAEIQYPAHLIDFEAIQPDLPILIDHSPYQLLPFQWSCHTLQEAPTATLSDWSQGHSEFLHQEKTDPRNDFVASLLARVRDGGSILHYHHYEKVVIERLAREGIPGAEELKGYFPRFIDLCTIIDECYADPRFQGRTSIKRVLPVVAPHLSYQDLSISNGDDAQNKYTRFLKGGLTPEEEKQLFKDLLEYCKLDTWAMVEILKALLLASG